MKIVCQSCNSAFNVDDAKIPKGKKVGVKCKSCGAVIVILPDGNLQGGSAGDGAAEAPEAPPPVPKPAPAPKTAAPAPAADDPFGGGDDPFAGFSEDSLEVEGAAAVPPPSDSFETEAPPEPEVPDFSAPEPEPPKPAAKAAPSAGAGAMNDPFAEDADLGGPQFEGASEFSSSSATQEADGNFSFDEADSGGDDGGGSALDELDAIDRAVEKDVKTSRNKPAAGSATIGLDADAFYDPASVAAGQYMIKNAKGQSAGPFSIDKVKELLKGKKIGAKDEISRNDGPWLSVKILLETNVDNTDLEKFLATASAEKSGALAGGFSFDEEAMGRSGLSAGRFAGNIRLVIGVVIGVVVLLIAGGGGYWWYLSREVDLAELTTPKLKELISSRRSVTGSREEASKQALQKAEAVVKALLVEQFPEAERDLKTAIQKNPSNFEAAATLVRLYAFWSEMLGDRSKLQEALALADVVKSVDPNPDYTQIAVSHANRVAGKTDEAIAAAQHATTVNPNSAEAQTAFAYALLGKSDRLADAQAAVDKAVSAGADNQLALLVQARILEMQKDYAGAAAAFDKAIAARQNALYPRLMKARFILNRMPDKVSEAIELLKAAESAKLNEVKPFKSKVLITRANVLLAGGQSGEALAKAKEADGVFPSAETKTAIGDALFVSGQVSEALLSYQEAVKLDKTYQPGHQRLGKTHLAIGENDKGEAALKEAVRLDPSDLAGRVMLGQAYAKAGKLEDAQKEYEAVIGLDPKNADAYVSLGQLQLTQGLTQDALGSFDKAIELDPQNPDTFIAIGKTYWELGDVTNAIARTRQAVELAPLKMATHQQLARFLWDTGDFTASLSSFDQAIQLIKEGEQNSGLYLERAIVKFFLKNYTEAIADMQKAYEIKKSEPQTYFWHARALLAKAREEAQSDPAAAQPDLQAAQGEFSKGDYHSRGNPLLAYWWGESYAELRDYGNAHVQMDTAIKKVAELSSKGWSTFLDPEIAKARIFVRQEKWRDAHAQYALVLPKIEQEEKMLAASGKFRVVPDTASLAEQMMDWHPRRWAQWEEDRKKFLFDTKVEGICTMGYVEKDELDKPDVADATLARCLALKPNNGKAHYYRCNIANDKTRYKDGLVHCQRAVSNDPNLGEAYVQLGYGMLYEKSDVKAAMDNWRKALRKQAGLSDKRKKDVIGEMRSQGTGDDEIARNLRNLGYNGQEVDYLMAK